MGERKQCPWYEGKCTINTEIDMEVDKEVCQGQSRKGDWISCLRAQVDLTRDEDRELNRMVYLGK